MALRITTGMEIRIPIYYYRFSFCAVEGEDKEEVEPVARDMKMFKYQRARNQRALQIRYAMF
ncbi:hypothetical protein MKX03_030494 [Papaver bracteatum]|nr:hypothetical protein MKX03_030494 [Papaver bracteatum]